MAVLLDDIQKEPKVKSIDHNIQNGGDDVSCVPRIDKSKLSRSSSIFHILWILFQSG
jgi:hypothetical protein